MGVKSVKPITVQHALDPLGINLETLRMSGPTLIGGSEEVWANVGLDTKLPLPTIAILMTAARIAPLLERVGKSDILPALIKGFQPIIVTIPDVVQAQLEGVELGPVVLNLVDNYLLQMIDCEGDVKTYSLSENREIPVKDLDKALSPVESFSIILSTLFYRLFSNFYELTGSLPRETAKSVDTAPMPG